MKREGQAAQDSSRNLLHALRNLGRENAPGTLLPKVIRSVCLADSYFPFETPLGRVFIAFNPCGVSAVMGARNPRAFERIYQKRFGRAAYAAAEPPPGVLASLPGARSESRGRRVKFNLESISEFERAVLKKTLEIPRGEVRPYSWIAREIGRPRAVRAVGTALARNPIPLLIPCHRVIRSDGRIGGYAFGKEAKRAVLAAEGVDLEALAPLADSKTRYWGSDTTRIFCFPACRQARRISVPHRVSFRSDRDALASGYRPCKMCRPLPLSLSAPKRPAGPFPK